ncbi:MAG: hypothetical protein GX271_01230 [Clostridiales bacterium]|nr:hypothetical protein [Clostridiales bacterium]
MVWILYLCAVIIIGYAVFAPILGVIPFSFTLLMVNGVFAVLFIALANILSNQEEILNKLDHHENKLKLLSTEKKKCTKCNHSYDIDYKSCPKCGYTGDL